MQLSDIVDVVGLTPVPSPQPSSEAPQEEGGIRCVCGNDEDDGFTIQCDGCLVWQHALCVGIARNNVPEEYLCEECRPEVDVESGAKRRRHAREGAATAAATTAGTVNEISENIVAPEAVEWMGRYAGRQGEAKLKMPRIPPDEPLGTVNFELARVVVFPSAAALGDATKTTEMRELRVRALGRRSGVARMGVFAGEDIDPGALIGEYLGHVQPTDSLAGRRKGAERVSQSHVLFCGSTPELVVDARRFGNMLRSVRRSCRANCEAKLVITEAEAEAAEEPSKAVHWCLFARNTIREGEELFLPFDYAEGNAYFSYECCCAYPELCLADDMAPSTGGGSATGSGVGGRERGASIFHAQTAAPAPSASVVSARAMSVDSMATAGRKPVDRKLSREERKLQQYIEFIERMESAEKKQHRKSTSASNANSPPAATSPKRSASRSSSSKPSPSKRSDSEGTIKTDPGAAPPTSSPLASLNASPGKLPLKKMLSRSLVQHKPAAEVIAIKPDPGAAEEKRGVDAHAGEDVDTHAGEDADVDVDVESVTSTGASAPDTPSKRKVSLSDYLSRRKSSPSAKPAVEGEAGAEAGGADLDADADAGADARAEMAPKAKAMAEAGPTDGAARGDRGVAAADSGVGGEPPLPVLSPAQRYSTPPPPMHERKSYEQSPREYDRWRREEGDRRDGHPPRRYPLFTDGNRPVEGRDYGRDYHHQHHHYHHRDPRSQRDGRDGRDGRDARDNRDARDARDSREGREGRGDPRDHPRGGGSGRDPRDLRDHRDGRLDDYQRRT